LAKESRENKNNNSSEEEEKEMRNEDGDEGKQQDALLEDNAILIIAENEGKGDDLEDYNNMHMQAVETDMFVDWTIEEVEPLNHQNLEAEEDLEFEVSIWVGASKYHQVEQRIWGGL